MSLVGYVGADIHDGEVLWQGKALLVEDGAVRAICAVEALPEGCEVRRMEGGFLSLGFVDLQVNGGGGVLFNDARDVEALATLAEAHRGLGTRALLPTLITDTFERTAGAIDAVEAAITARVEGIAGLHLEGPHLAVAKKGAHDGALIRAMDAEDLRLLCRACERIENVLLTVAPEAVSTEQVRELTRAGAIVSLGHSDAEYDTAMVYFEAGARMATHLFNAMSQIGSREPGLVGAALAHGGCAAGLIADGVHVHPATIRAALAAKQGPGAVFLVSDAMSCVGSDITEFELNGRRILRSQGALRLEDGTLAGADVDMARSVKVLVEQVGLQPERAIAMATSVPAGMLKSGTVDVALVGARVADLVYLDAEFRVQKLS